MTFRHPRRPQLHGNDRVALKTVFSDPNDPYAPITVVPVDVETGQPVEEQVDIYTALHQQRLADREALRAGFQQNLNVQRGLLDRPWLDQTPNPRQYYHGETGRQVLSEFVPGGSAPDTTTPLPVTMQNLSMGHRPSQEVDISSVPTGFPGMPQGVNVLPAGQSLAWAQANGMVQSDPQPQPGSPIPQTLNSDIPGIVYVHAAEDLIAHAKRQGYREAFVDMEVTRDSTAFAEFKAVMTGEGYTVNIEDICYKTDGMGSVHPQYRVAITW